jgi:uncharacterized protein
MRWDGERESQNVEDRRGMRMPGGGKGIGLGAIVIALIASAIFGVNPLTVLGLLGGGGAMAPTSSQQQSGPAATSDDTRFVRVVVASTEDVWTPLFQRAGARYEPPTLVVFRGATQTACGPGQSAMGPFYCPADRKVYLDLDFFDTLKQRLGAPGDFAQAYVIAHEVGHHVQNLLGISEKAHNAQRQAGEAQGNAISVRVELQADCFAGVWAHHSQQAKQWLEAGDIEEAMNAAAQIGDDTLQRKSQGRIVPESFTHGTSAQRVEWFKRGLSSGRVADCNSFGSTASR